MKAAERSGGDEEAAQIRATLETWDQIPPLERALLATGRRDDLLEPPPEAESQKAKTQRILEAALARSGFACPICRRAMHLGGCQPAESPAYSGALCPICGQPFHAGGCKPA